MRTSNIANALKNSVIVILMLKSLVYKVVSSANDKTLPSLVDEEISILHILNRAAGPILTLVGHHI